MASTGHYMTPSCGVCAQPASFSKKFLCSFCKWALVLDDYVAYIEAQSQLAEASDKVNELVGHGVTYQRYQDVEKTAAAGSMLVTDPVLPIVEAQRAHLHFYGDRIRSESERIRLSIQAKREEISRLKDAVGAKAHKVKVLEHKITASIPTPSPTKTEPVATISSHKLCGDLLNLFGVYKRKRKQKDGPQKDCKGQDYDIFIGFTVVPDLALLSHYKPAVINTALERLAYLVAFMAYYLDLRLPYDILLPHRDHPHARMAYRAKGLIRPLRVDESSSIFSLVRDHVQKFEEFMEVVAMLAMCLRTVAEHHGIKVSELQEIGSLNKIIYQIALKYDPRTKDSGSTTQASKDPVLLTALRDYLCNLVYVQVHGDSQGSAEWDLLDD